MVIIQKRARRKPSGGRYKSTLSKRTHMIGREPALTKIGTLRALQIPVKGGATKGRLLSVAVANVYDPKAKKHVQAKIKMVTESPANRNFIRRNIITRGTIIDTDKGKARVTSRPGQHGTMNAVLL